MMKVFCSLVFSFVLGTLLAVSAFAQTQTVQTPKIGLINTLAFEDDKAGIAKYTAAMKSVETGFKTELDALTALGTRLQNLENELTALQKQLAAAATPTVPANLTQLRATYSTKGEEYEKLGREFKFKQDDLKARYQRRRQEVMRPILLDIGKAMQEFAKQKGYMMILDGAKLEENGILLAVGDDKVDLTKDFITFYNARQTTPVRTPTK